VIHVVLHFLELRVARHGKTEEALGVHESFALLVCPRKALGEFSHHGKPLREGDAEARRYPWRGMLWREFVGRCRGSAADVGLRNLGELRLYP